MSEKLYAVINSAIGGKGAVPLDGKRGHPASMEKLREAAKFADNMMGAFLDASDKPTEVTGPFLEADLPLGIEFPLGKWEDMQ